MRGIFGSSEPLIPFLPTLRLIRLIALGAPLWLLALFLPAGWLVGMSYLLLLAALCWRDARTIPARAELSAERRLPPRFAFDVEQPITLALVNRSARSLHAKVRDELPEPVAALLR